MKYAGRAAERTDRMPLCSTAGMRGKSGFVKIQSYFQAYG